MKEKGDKSKLILYIEIREYFIQSINHFFV